MFTEENDYSYFSRILLAFLFIALIIVLAMWFLTGKTNNKLTPLLDNIYNENVENMKEAAQSYYTIERMPEEIGDVERMTLVEMLDKKLMLPFTDGDNNICDNTLSYVELTKFENEFTMKVNLVCPERSDYIIVHIGCYNVCDDNGCKEVLKEIPEEEEEEIEELKETVYIVGRDIPTKIIEYQFKKPVYRTVNTESAKYQKEVTTETTIDLYKYERPTEETKDITLYLHEKILYRTLITLEKYEISPYKPPTTKEENYTGTCTRSVAGTCSYTYPCGSDGYGGSGTCTGTYTCYSTQTYSCTKTRTVPVPAVPAVIGEREVETRIPYREYCLVDGEKWLTLEESATLPEECNEVDQKTETVPTPGTELCLVDGKEWLTTTEVATLPANCVEIDHKEESSSSTEIIACTVGNKEWFTVAEAASLPAECTKTTETKTDSKTVLDHYDYKWSTKKELGDGWVKINSSTRTRTITTFEYYGSSTNWIKKTEIPAGYRIIRSKVIVIGPKPTEK